MKRLKRTVPWVAALFVLVALAAAGTRTSWPKEAHFGRAGDVIVPLNVRDPSALVMAPGSAKCYGECPQIERPQ